MSMLGCVRIFKKKTCIGLSIRVRVQVLAIRLALLASMSALGTVSKAFARLGVAHTWQAAVGQSHI